jgi:serine/threonine protein kinase
LIFKSGARTALKRISGQQQDQSVATRLRSRNRWPDLILEENPSKGGISVVYQSLGCFRVKLNIKNLPESKEALKLEWEIYELLSEAGKRGEGADNGGPQDELKFPTPFGLFENTVEDDLAIIISNDGKQLPDFSNLTAVEKYVSSLHLSIMAEILMNLRKQIWRNLMALHRAGIVHNDFEPRNVVRGLRGLVLIDFSHSVSNHRCPGPHVCEELVYAHQQLWGYTTFPDDGICNTSLSSSLIWSLIRVPFFTVDYSLFLSRLNDILYSFYIRGRYWIICISLIAGCIAWSVYG